MTYKPESWSYTLPEIKDDDNSGELTLIVNFGAASGFITLNGKTMEVSNVSDVSKVRPASYFIKVTISDSIDSVDF
jgi:hypothetical protein